MSAYDPSQGGESQDQLAHKAEGLTVAVGRMGQVTEAKRVLDMHANITRAVAQQLAERGYVHLWKGQSRRLCFVSSDPPSLQYVLVANCWVLCASRPSAFISCFLLRCC